MDAAQFDLYFEARLAFVDLPDARIAIRHGPLGYDIEVYEPPYACWAPEPERDLWAAPASVTPTLADLPRVEHVPALVTCGRVQVRPGTTRAAAHALARRLRRERDLGRARLLEHS